MFKMDKMTLEELLLQWGLPNEVVEKFLQNEIQISQLIKLTPKDLELLIPKIGERIQFQTAMEKHYSEFQCEATAQSKLTDSKCNQKRLVAKESEKIELTKKDDDLRNCIIGILDKVNLDTTSMKAMFNLVFAEYPLLDLSLKKDFIRDTINSLLSRPVTKRATTTATAHDHILHAEWKSNSTPGHAITKSKKSFYVKTSGRQPDVNDLKIKEHVKRIRKSIDWKSNSKDGCAKKKSNRSLFKKASREQTYKNDPKRKEFAKRKKKEFVRRILQSIPVLRSMLLKTVKESLKEPYVSKVLYAENIETIIAMELNVKEGGYNCPLCSRFMTPQFRWNRNKDYITWDVSNFQRHLLLFHSDQSTSYERSLSESSDDGSLSDSSVSSSESDYTVHVDNTAAAIPFHIDAQNRKTNSSTSSVHSAATTAIIILNDDDECCETHVMGAAFNKSIKIEPENSVKCIIDRPSIEPAVEPFDAQDRKILSATTTIIVLSDDDECYSIKIEPADSVAHINQSNGQPSIESAADYIHAAVETFDAQDRKFENLKSNIHSATTTIIVLSDDDDCYESPVVFDSTNSIKIEPADSVPHIIENNGQSSISINATVGENNIHNDTLNWKSEIPTSCEQAKGQKILDDVHSIDSVIILNENNEAKNQEMDTIKPFETEIAEVHSQPTADYDEHQNVDALITQKNKIQPKEKETRLRSGRLVKW